MNMEHYNGLLMNENTDDFKLDEEMFDCIKYFDITTFRFLIA